MSLLVETLGRAYECDSSMMDAGDNEEGSVLCVAKVLLPFHLRTETNKSVREYVPIQYMKCITALEELDKEIAVCVTECNITDEEDHSAFAGENLNNRTKLKVGEWLEVAPFSGTSAVESVLSDN